MSVPVVKQALAVPRIHCPSLESFKKDYLDPQKPVILEGIIDHWPAFKNHPWRYLFLYFVSFSSPLPLPSHSPPDTCVDLVFSLCKA